MKFDKSVTIDPVLYKLLRRVDVTLNKALRWKTTRTQKFKNAFAAFKRAVAKAVKYNV